MAWLENIRKSDRQTKFRYVILFSSIIGILVVWLWALSIKSIIENVTKPQPVAESSSTTNFVGTIYSLWNGIVDRTKNTIELFKQKASEQNQIEIQKDGGQ